MADLKKEFIHLMARVIEEVGNENVDNIKRNFSEKIDSKRCLYNIHTFHELLEILEKRDEISENDTSVLKECVKLIGKQDILDLVTAYEKLYGSSWQCETCNREKIAVTSSGSHFTPTPSQEPMGDSDLAKAILYISHEIGTQWTILARTLGVRESDIEEVEQNGKGLQEKAYLGLMKWTLIKSANVNMDNFKYALRSRYIHRNDLADNLDSGEYL